MNTIVREHHGGDFSRSDDRGTQLRRQHRLVLAGSCIVVVTALCLEVLPEGRVGLRGLEGIPLPHACLSRILFEGRCPGCGLTRSFVHLAHSDWRASLKVHRAGWLLALAVLVQIPYRLAALLGRNPAPAGEFVPKAFGGLLVALLLGNWIFEIVFGWVES